MTDIREILSQAVMGDERALDEVAGLLRSLAPTADPAAQARFMDAVANFREEFRDLHNNEDDLKTVVQVDAHLARTHPELDYETRLKIVGNTVRRGGFETLTEDADRSMAIQEMREARKGHALPRRPGRGPDESHLEDSDEQAIQRMRVRGRLVPNRGVR